VIDADEIVPGLWQGSVPPRGNKLRRAGFHLVVLAAREWQLFDETFEGVEVVRAPLDDEDILPIPRGDLRGALQAAHRTAEAIAKGKKCLVTCAAGMNRSGLISALTLHLLYGWPGETCIREVQEGRGPAKDGYLPLSNQQFLRFLRNLPARQGRYVLLDIPSSRRL
jgi:protein-tyrosine phosphatase